MSDYTTVFDHENQQVGFAKSNCDGVEERTVDCCRGGVTTCAGHTYTPVTGGGGDGSATFRPSATQTTKDVDMTSSPSINNVDVIHPASSDEATMRTVNALLLIALFLFLGLCVFLLCKWRTPVYSRVSTNADLNQGIREATSSPQQHQQGIQMI
jgi:hypothetical protein